MARTKLDIAVKAAANTMLQALRNMRLGGTVSQLSEELEAVQVAVIDALLQGEEGPDVTYRAPSASAQVTINQGDGHAQ